jgi:cyclin-dependent kinase
MVISILGTPNDETWPGVKQLPDYKPSFPSWSRQDIMATVPTLDKDGIDLVEVSGSYFLPFSMH